jgi:hypothetical protein
LALARVQLRAVGLAAETDTALALARRQIRPVGLAAETDTAFALLPPAVGASVGRANETDLALALSGFAFFPAPVDGTSRRLVIQAEARAMLIQPEARTLVIQKSTKLARQLPERSPQTTTREPRRLVVLEE